MRLLFFAAALCVPAFSLKGNASNILNVSSTGNLVITEIMADPDPPVSLPSAEYVEIYNRSNQPVNLTGWILFDGSARVLPSVNIDPGEFVVICAASDSSLFSGIAKIAAVSSLSLTNTGEKISLRDPGGFPVDSVTYSDSWYGTGYKKDGGWSLEKVDLHFDCPLAINWKPSISPGGGTPGLMNSVNGVTIDDTEPVLIRAFCPDAFSATLIFSEPMDAATLQDVSNYNCNLPGNPFAAIIQTNETDKVTIFFADEIPVNTICSLMVNNVTDCAGNLIEANSITRFGISPGEISIMPVINEILFNPGEKGTDFIELVHPGNDILNLNQFKIAGISLETNEIESAVSISSGDWLMFPGDYIILTEDPGKIQNSYASSFPKGFITISGLPSMNADEGHVGIMNGATLTDHLYYHEDFHFSLLNDTKGISLEKIHPLRNGMNPGSWHSASPSSGFATPGLKNSQFTDIISTDKNVSVSPEIFSPDHDGVDDIVTFEMNTGKPGYISNLRIYNATGHMIYHNTANFPVAPHDHLSWDGIDDNGNLAPAGIYMALFETFNLEGEMKNYKLPFVLAIKN